jgi:hypothetical protein
MIKTFQLFVVGACMAMALAAGPARAADGTLRNCVAERRAAYMPWQGYYYDAAWGMPIALVVPPNAEAQTHYGWGVGNTRVTTIYHQFHRGYPGGGVYDRRAYLPTPPWPSDTDQFGVYYVRGPW